MNPFKEKSGKVQDTFMNWQGIYPAPYDKHAIDPHTRTRVILMNGTEFEANWFSHQFSRHEMNNDLRRDIAVLRRSEQQQQKFISALKPKDESVLEHTIGYEQLAVDLTAELAKTEPDATVKAALDFALLEDFDHLYRYADLLEMEAGIFAENLVGGYTEIMPGRPTIAEHRCPNDSIFPHIDASTAAMQTKLCVGIITAAEQQTMNYYMNVCGFYSSDLGRQLYQEIAMIEEQHVTQYGSLMDPSSTWLEALLMHQYTECYLYWSCMQSEADLRMKSIWHMLMEQEIAHLHMAADMLKKYEKKDWQQVMGTGEFPAPLYLTGDIDYVRGVLASSVNNTQQVEKLVDVSTLPKDSGFFAYQSKVNGDVASVPSHMVIDKYIFENDMDYRFETMLNPIVALRDRKVDNTSVGRTPTPVMAGTK